MLEVLSVAPWEELYCAGAGGYGDRATVSDPFVKELFPYTARPPRVPEMQSVNVNPGLDRATLSFLSF